jgi:hypothetical protein
VPSTVKPRYKRTLGRRVSYKHTLGEEGFMLIVTLGRRVSYKHTLGEEGFMLIVGMLIQSEVLL